MPMKIALNHIWLMVAICCLGTRTILAAGIISERYQPDCSVDHNNGRTVSHPIDNQMYWICTSDGKAIPKRCTGSERFIAKTSSCGNIPLRSMMRGAPNDENTFECPSKGLHRFVLDGSCTNYITCLSGSYSVRSCADELHFDGVLLGCNFKAKANCDRDWCPLKDREDEIVTRPSMSSCEEFYVCSGGRPVPFKCLNNLHWNEAIQDCDFPASAKCPIPPPEDSEENTEPPPRLTCRPGPGVYTFPHPTNCSEYFLCVGDVEPYPRVCAPTLIFNPTIGECERPGTGEFVCPHHHAFI